MPDIFFNPRQIDQNDEEQEVDDDGNPRCFPAARSREIVLQLDEQMRHPRIQIAISVLPVLAVVKAELFRLRLRRRRRSYRIMKWNLGDRHAAALASSACR